MRPPANATDCRDWRDVPITVGCHIVWPSGGDGSYMTEGVVEEIVFTGHSYAPFRIKVLPLSSSGYLAPKPRRQWLERQLRLTVVQA